MSDDPLPLLLRALRLPTMAEEYARAIAAAEAENWGYRRFLTHLAEAETSDRTTRRIQRMLDDSGLPSGKTLASLDLHKWPEKVRRQLPTLLEADFVRRGDTVCAFGLPGRGKSTFVAALAREWIQRHQLRVLFTPTFKLVGQLLAAKRDLKLNAALAKLQRYDALCLDELGYTQQSSEEGDILFQPVSYTHLDVYKRQGSGRALGGAGECGIRVQKKCSRSEVWGKDVGALCTGGRTQR